MSELWRGPERPRVTRFGKAFVAYWIFSMLFGLALTGGVIWAAVHFIKKYW